MSFFQRSLALLVLLLAAMPAAAFGWGLRPARTAAYYYAYPAPVVAAPVYPSVPYAAPVAVAPPIAVPAAPPAPYCPPATPPAAGAPIYAPVTPAPPAVGAPIYAPATPAPPSESPVQRAPEVRESQFLSLAPNSATSSLCTITFWNHSGRTQTLRIDGLTRVLAPGKGLTLDLPRQFVWQLGGQDAQVERVSTLENAREISIRR